MSKLIVICGAPGTGKTTLSKVLSKKLNMVCIHKDVIKERLYELRSGGSLNDSKVIGNETAQLVFQIAESQIENGVDLMIEIPFGWSANSDRLQQWQKDFDLQVTLVICSVSEDERNDLVKTRERHKAHHDKERSFDVSVADYVKIFDEFPGSKIYMECNRPVDELVDELIGRLKT